MINTNWKLFLKFYKFYLDQSSVCGRFYTGILSVVDDFGYIMTWAPKKNSTITSKQILQIACLFFVFTKQKQHNIFPSSKDSVTIKK